VFPRVSFDRWGTVQVENRSWASAGDWGWFEGRLASGAAPLAGPPPHVAPGSGGVGWAPWRVLAVTGNVTTTTVRGLLPGAWHQFRVAALTEDGSLDRRAWQQLDLYGQRAAMPQAHQGPWRTLEQPALALGWDVAYDWFDASALLAHGPAQANASHGQLANWAGEGRRGFVPVGSAQVAGCNASATCCDGWGATTQDADGDGLPDRVTS